jgi:hypothetical protein
MSKHCLRANGTVRAWFETREDAEAFERIQPNYRGDVPHLCVCGFWHLARPAWLCDSRYQETVVGERAAN